MPQGDVEPVLGPALGTSCDPGLPSKVMLEKPCQDSVIWNVMYYHVR